MKRLIGAAILLGLSSLPSMAASEGFVVASCPGSLGVNAYTAGQYGAITVDVNGIQCTSGSGGGGGGGLSVQDGATFTAGTSNFTPSGGEYNSSPTALTSGTQGTLALNQYRAAFVDVMTTNNNLFAAVTSPVPCKAAATWNASTGLTGTQPSGCDGSAALWHDLGAVGGTGVATGNGTSGAGNQRVNIASDNSPIPTQGQVNVTATDCSGTVVTGGTAVNAFTAQATLHGFTIFNTNTSEVMWISFTTTAAASTAGSYPIPAATATTFAGGGSFTSPPGFGLNHALSVVAATSAHSFSCTWW